MRTADANITRGGDGARVLLVEDDLDSRDALALFLDHEGFDAVATGTAEEALARLRTERFDFLLTDLQLPGESGSWLIANGRREGRLDGTRVFLVTAHPDARPEEGVVLVKKPLDLDRLVQLMAPSTPRRGAAAGAESEDEPKVELVLYIAPTSLASGRALRHVERVLHGAKAGTVRLSVVDLAEHPEGGVDDRIAFTPTLVRRKPGPRAWFVGDLRGRAIVEQILIDAGVERSKR